MKRRNPRLLAKIEPKKPKEDVVVFNEPYVPPVKTEVDKLYDLIDERSCYGYRFCESEYSLPWIRKEDIEDRDDGLFVIRFRCPVFFERYGMKSVIKEVCERVGSDEHFVYKKSEEYGLEFIEAVWVVQKGENNTPERNGCGCGEIHATACETKGEICQEEDNRDGQEGISEGTGQTDLGCDTKGREATGQGDRQDGKGFPQDKEGMVNGFMLRAGDDREQEDGGTADRNLSEREILNAIELANKEFG